MRAAEWIALGSMVGIVVLACAGTRPGADSRSPTRAAVTPRAPAASVPATASSAPAVAPEVTPFQLVAAADDLQLAPLGDETYVTVGCNGGGPFASARIVGSTLELSNALTEGWRCPSSRIVPTSSKVRPNPATTTWVGAGLDSKR